mgnify:CR=1 FL=1
MAKTPEQKQRDAAMRASKDKALRNAGLVQRKVWATPEQHELEKQLRENTVSGRIYNDALAAFKAGNV